MPDFYEKPRSRKQRLEYAGRSLTRNWFCRGSSDEEEVRSLALANNPSVYLGLLRKSVDLTPLHTDIWDVDVEYGIGAPSGLSPTTFAFKIGTQNVHITQSLETLFRVKAGDEDYFATGDGTNLTVDGVDNTLVTPDGYTPVAADEGKTLVISDDSPGGWTAGEYEILGVVGGKWDLDSSPAATGTAGGIWELQAADGFIGNAPDHSGAIGVTEDSVAGCEILAPKMEFSITTQRPEVTYDYLITLFNLVGKTNSGTFFGKFPPGSLLYFGAEPTQSLGQLTSGEEFPIWTLAHQFAYERTRLSISVGAITVPKKRGWEYLWAHFGYSPASTGMKRPPDACYVERVYEAGNYELLEIPGSGGEE